MCELRKQILSSSYRLFSDYPSRERKTRLLLIWSSCLFGIELDVPSLQRPLSLSPPLPLPLLFPFSLLGWRYSLSRPSPWNGSPIVSEPSLEQDQLGPVVVVVEPFLPSSSWTSSFLDGSSLSSSVLHAPREEQDRYTRRQGDCESFTSSL